MKKAIFYDHLIEAAKQTGRPMEEILAEVKALGYDGVELGSQNYREDRAAFKAMLDRAGLKVSSVYRHFDFGHKIDREEMEAHLGDLVFLGAKKTLLIPGFFDESSDQEAEFGQMVKALNLFCELAAPLGITATLEDFDDRHSPCSTMAGLRRFMDAVPALRFTLDTGNFRYSCEDVEEAYELLKDRLAHVHLKDRSVEPLHAGDGGPAALDGRTLYPAPVGSGYIPIEALIRKAMADGYDDWYAAEHFDAADMMGFVRKSAEYLRKL